MSAESDCLFASEIAVPRRVSKKRHIYEGLLARIQNHSLPVGTKLPSATVLASEWQVAYATVHAALNELMREGWLIRSPKQGTFVSASTPKPASLEADTVAVALPPREDIILSGQGNEVFEMLQGLTEGARLSTRQVRIESISSSPDSAEIERAFESMKRSSGAVFIGQQYSPLIERLVKCGVPVVTLANDPGFGNVITYDRKASMQMAVEHLAARGCQKISYFGNVTDATGKFTTFLETLEKLGLTHDDKRNCHAKIRNAEESLKRLLDSNVEIDAVLALNYKMAFVFAREAEQRGIRLPQDTALMGFGISETGITDRPISYVKVPYLEFGIEAMKRLTSSKQMPVQSNREILTLKTELILRATA